MQKPYYNTGFWAIILGGSSGMGLASAKQLAASGMNLCLVYRERRAKLKSLSAEIEEMQKSGVKVLANNLDVSKEENVHQILNELKAEMTSGDTVRLLLHSVARGNLKPMYSNSAQQPELSNEDLELTIDSMALNWYRWAKAIIQQKLFAHDARLLAFTSEGSRMAWKSYGAVSAAKATLESLARSMAVEFAPLGIRCNVLQPGVTDTPSLRMIPGSSELVEQSIRRNPFKRLTIPADVARVVDLMCRDESAWINGAIVPVDGGENISG